MSKEKMILNKEDIKQASIKILKLFDDDQLSQELAYAAIVYLKSVMEKECGFSCSEYGDA